MYVLSSDARVGQAVVIFVTGTFFLGLLPSYLAGHIVLPTTILVALGISNWIASRNHYIYFTSGKIHIRSLYAKKKIFSGNQFLRVDVIIPGQSYYYLYLSNGRRYFFSRTNYKDIITYFKGGDQEIVDEMNQAIRIELSN